jgi:hypothetical protein
MPLEDDRSLALVDRPNLAALVGTLVAEHSEYSAAIERDGKAKRFGLNGANTVLV